MDKLERKIKYYNCNFSPSRSTHSISYDSPSFSAGITSAKADTSTAKLKLDKIFTSAARKPDFAPPALVSLDSSFTKSGCEGGSSCKVSSKSPSYKNCLETSLMTNPVYSPQFLQELREKYNRKHRDVDRKIAEQKINKRFFENKKEETQEELEERIMKHMKITQADLENTYVKKEEEELEERIRKHMKITQADVENMYVKEEEEELEERIRKHMKITQADVEDMYVEEEEEEELELPEITQEMNEVILRAKQSGGQVLVARHNIPITIMKELKELEKE